MTLDVYADLFDEDLDSAADRLDEAIRCGKVAFCAEASARG